MAEDNLVFTEEEEKRYQIFKKKRKLKNIKEENQKEE